MNRPLSRHATPAAAARTGIAAPVLRLNPFAAAVRLGILALACTALPAVAQLPTGNTPVSGTAGVTINGDVMSINQTTDFAHINWATFNIGVDNSVEITQNANAFLLNQVAVNGGASSILGTLSGPGGAQTAGQVAIINPAGILIGSTGIINVGGLIASSLTISGLGDIGNGNGNSGPESITLDAGGTDNGIVIEEGGTITTGAGGALLGGSTVSNSGNISSTGPVQMISASGMVIGVEEASNTDTTMRAPPTVDSVSLTARGADGNSTAVANSGSITAPSIRLEANVAPGLSNIVNNSGTLVATGVVADSNGTVRLVGVGGSVSTGTVTAQGNGTGVGVIEASASGGDLVVGDLDTGTTGSVTIAGSARIVDDDDATEADVTTGTLTADAGTGIDLQTAVGNLDASVSGTGAIVIDQADSGITLSDVDTNDGDITITSGGAIVATDVAATGGTASLTAAGDVLVDSVSGSDVALQSSGGKIDEDAATDETADVTTAGTLTASAATTINLQTDAGSLAADTNNGGITIAETDGIALTSVDATGGDVSVTAAAGDILVDSVSGPNVTLVATAGRIQEVSTGADATADVTTAGVLTATAATGIDLQTSVGSVDASVTGDGDLVIDEIGSGITLTDVDTGNGSLTVTADGTITATDVAATGGTASLTASSGNVEVASVSGPDVTLTSTAGSIQEVATGDADPDVTSAGLLTAPAADGIDLQTSVASLSGTVTGSGGALMVTDADGIALTSVETNGGDVSVTATTGDIAVDSVSGSNVTLLATAGGIREVGGGADDDADVTTTGTLTATAATGIDLQTAVGSLDGSVTGDGDLVVDQIGSGITLTDVDTSNGSLTVTAGGTIVATDVAATGGTASLTATSGNVEVASVSGPDVTLQATTGSIQEVGGGAADAGADVTTAGLLTATAQTGIDLQTAVGSLDGSVTGDGDLVIDQSGSGLTLTNVDTSNGSLTVTAGGTIVATDVAATGGTASLTATSGNVEVASVSGPDVTLISNAGAIQEVAGGDAGADVISAGTLTATAATGIDLQTSVAALDGTVTGAGSALTLTETDGITLTGVTTNGGDVSVTATGGDIDVASVSGSNVTLVSSTGEIKEVAGGDDAADVTTAGLLTATAATGIHLQTAVGSLDGSVTGSGDLVVDQIGSGITLADVDTHDGALSVTADGTITATDVAATGGTATLTADSGNIEVASVSGPNVTLTAANGAIQEVAVTDADADVTSTGVLTVDAASGVDLATDVASLVADVTGAGAALTVTETNGIALTDVATNNGNITVTANAGNIVAGTVDAGTADVTLTANTSGAQQIRDDVATLEENATTRIVGGAITLSAGGGIGAGSEDVDIDGDSLAAQTTTGPLNVNEANSVNLTTFTNNLGGDVALSTGTAQTVGAIDVGTHDLSFTTRDAGADLTVGGTLAGASVTLSSGGAIVDGNATHPDVQATTLTATAASGVDLDTAVANLSVSGGAGAISLDQATGDLALTNVANTSGGITVNAANGALTVTNVNAGTGAATLTASGAISGTGGGTHVTAQSLDATSATAGIDLTTAVANLSASAGGTGDIDVTNATAISLDDLGTAAGNIGVAASAGNITVGTISAGGGTGDVTLTASGAGQSIRDDGNDGAGPTRVTGNIVTLDAGTDIGSESEDLDTAASTIVATASGVINIDELDGATVDATNPNGPLELTAGGTSVVNSDVATLDASVSGPGSLTIDEADDVIIGTVRTDSGPVALEAGGNITAGTILGDGVDIQSGGDILVTNGGEIDGRDGLVAMTASGDIRQDAGVNPAVSGDKISIVAGGNVGFPNLPLTLDAGNGAVVIQFSDGTAAAFVSGVFGSLNEGPRVLGLGSNTVLANNVGAIQSSFEERVSFKLDSSQFATETRIFSIEGTGILPPKDQRE